MENLNQQLDIDRLLPLLMEYALNFLAAVLILVVGWILAGWAKNRVIKMATGTGTRKIDHTLVPILGQGVKGLILLVTVLAVLGKFGVETTSIIAILGAAGLAIGLALQGTLSNIAAGMMLLVLRPFKIGDVVDVNGVSGVVDEIGLFTTEMHSFDNIGITLPNSQVWGNTIQNYSRFGTRRCDLEFGISYADDITRAMELIQEVLKEDERVLPEPEPLIAVGSLGDSSVNIRVRPWTKSGDLWPLYYALTKKVKEKFDANGISIPFPQRELHVINENNED